MTLDEMKAQRDALKEAINMGALQVKHGDKMVMYQSTDKMMQSLRRLDNEIAKLDGSKPKRQRYAYTAGKGL